MEANEVMGKVSEALMGILANPKSLNSEKMAAARTLISMHGGATTDDSNTEENVRSIISAMKNHQ